MKTFILILCWLGPLFAFSQFDQLYIERSNDTIECKIVELRPSYLAYIKKGEMMVDMKSTSEPLRLKLYQPDKTEGTFTTSDLLSMFRYSNTKDIIWFGLDFSHLKICKKSPKEKITTSVFESMNNFIIDQSKKEFLTLFSPSRSLIVSGISAINLAPVKAVNSMLDTEKMEKCEADVFVPLDYIRKSLGNYNIKPGQTGIGLVFFYNYINKPKEQIIITMVYFDIKTRTVLLTWTDEQPAGGAGIAWHWTSGLQRFINKLTISGMDFQTMYVMYKW